MSAAAKVTDVEELVQQLADARGKLQERKARLLAEVATIDEALGEAPTKAKPKAPKTPSAPKAGAPRVGSVAEAITLILGREPKLTIREIQVRTDHPAKTVEATTRAMAADGRLIKDDQTPRHFSLPEKSTEPGELPAGSRPTTNGTATNGGARPQTRT